MISVIAAVYACTHYSTQVDCKYMYLVIGFSELFSICRRISSYLAICRHLRGSNLKFRIETCYWVKVVAKIGLSVACYLLPETSKELIALVSVALAYYFLNLVIHLKTDRKVVLSLLDTQAGLLHSSIQGRQSSDRTAGAHTRGRRANHEQGTVNSAGPDSHLFRWRLAGTWKCADCILQDFSTDC